MEPQIGGAIVATQYGLDPPLVTLMLGIGRTATCLTLPMWQYALQAVPSQRNVLTIWRNASSGNAFSEVVRTLPSLPSISVKRAATASSGAS
jgi:hypothetical protein